MRIDRFVARGFFLPLLVAAPPGCQLLRHQTPVPVLVRDAETGAPIPGARVELFRPDAISPTSAGEATGTTAADGVAELHTGPVGNGGVVVVAAARGYMLEGKELSDLPAKADAARPGPVVLDLFAEPRPAVELVVPAGYRGPIRADVRVPEDAARVAGQRQFVFAVLPTGTAEVSGPPVLRHLVPQDFTATYADGASIPRDVKPSEVGFRWVKSAGAVQHFIIGTQGELEELRKSLEPEKGAGSGHSAPAGPGGGRKGGHGGGRGRH